MNPMVTGLLGLFCLLLGLLLIAITATLVADMIGLVVALIGLGLSATATIHSVRRSPRR